MSGRKESNQTNKQISPEPFDRFSWNFTHMFLFVRQCAEHPTQLPKLKGKVTGQCQRIYPWISFALCISWTFDRFLWNFTHIFLLVNVQSTWPSYLDSKSQVKVKGLTLELRVHSISPEPFDQFSCNFTHMFLLVRRCAEHMTQLPRLKVTGQGQRIYPWISCPFHISWTIEAIFTQIFLWLR